MARERTRKSAQPARARHDYVGLDRVLHEKARLGILIALLNRKEGVPFLELRTLCELTDGNLVAKLLADQMNGKLPGIVGPGDRLWSYAFVDDVAAAHVSALERGGAGERYILAGANATLSELFAIASKRAGRTLEPRRLPFGLARLVGRALWLWADVTGKMPDLTHEAVDLLEKHWAYRSDKAVRELGYRVRPLEEGIRATVEWLIEEGHAQ